MTTWNQSWKASVKPRKQRIAVAHALLHARGEFLASHLSKELRQKHKHRALRVRVGDKVKIMRGTFRNKTGTVERVNTLKHKVYITGIELTKREGGKSLMPVHPSNLLIQELNLTDKKRLGEVNPK
jgi:large subunit ribosomal protein L24